MRNDVEQKLVKGEQFLVVFCAEANQCVVALAHFRFPPTQRIGIRGDLVGMLQEVLKTFDSLFQVVVVAGVDDGVVFDGITFGKLFPQLVNGIVPDDFGHILGLAWFGPPGVVCKEESTQFPIL